MPETHGQLSSPNNIKHARLARFLDRLCADLDQFVRTSDHPRLSGEGLINSGDVSEATGLLRELELTIQADRLQREHDKLWDRIIRMSLDAPDIRLLDAEVQSDMHLITIGLAGQLADFLRELRSDLSEMRLPKPPYDAAGEEPAENPQDPKAAAGADGSIPAGQDVAPGGEIPPKSEEPGGPGSANGDENATPVVEWLHQQTKEKGIGIKRAPDACLKATTQPNSEVQVTCDYSLLREFIRSMPPEFQSQFHTAKNPVTLTYAPTPANR